jgi:hypothetical protein
MSAAAGLSLTGSTSVSAMFLLFEGKLERGKRGSGMTLSSAVGNIAGVDAMQNSDAELPS